MMARWAACHKRCAVRDVIVRALPVLARPARPRFASAVVTNPLPLSPVLFAITATLAIGALRGQDRQTYRIAREDVLGTSSLLVVEAKGDAAAATVEDAVFGEVERLRHVLSTYDDDSELNGLVHAGQRPVSKDLAAVLKLAGQWRERTHGAFEPGTAALTKLWAEAAKLDKEPDGAALQAAVALFAQPMWTLQGDVAAVRGPIVLDAIAKGWIVDRAREVGDHAGGDAAHVASFQIGGDLCVGTTARDVAIVDPRQPAANGYPLATLHTGGRAVASSGGYERGFDVAGTHHSHVFDPHTGRPADGVLGASVVAADVATADVLATSLCVLPPAEGLALLAANAAEGVVVAADGSVHTSPGWQALLAPESAATLTASKPWPDGYALQVTFEIKAPEADGGRRRGGWKRPYVAVWIEDLTGEPVKTLCLWIENRRWLRDLRRWSRQYDALPNVTDLVSQATRKAGNYTLTWDGTSDEGTHLAPGRYTICIEATREHGTYQLIRKEIELGGDAVRVALAGGTEIASAELRFGRPLAEKTVR